MEVRYLRRDKPKNLVKDTENKVNSVDCHKDEQSSVHSYWSSHRTLGTDKGQCLQRVHLMGGGWQTSSE